MGIFTNEDINIFDNTNKKKLLRQSITYKYNNLIFIIFKNNEYRDLIYPDMAKHIMEKIYDKDILNLFFDNILSNIELFKKTYLLIPTIPYNDGDDYYTIKGKLNKLNEIGLLTYSYLNTSDKDQNLGLNIDLYRQKLYIEQKFKNNAEKIA